jgi:hypothetical protein
VTLIMALANSHGEAKSKAEQEAEALKTVKGAIDALDEATGRLHKSKQQQIADSAAATQGLLRRRSRIGRCWRRSSRATPIS